MARTKQTARVSASEKRGPPSSDDRSIATTPPTGAVLFSRFPPEIREQIWIEALVPGVVYPYHYGHTPCIAQHRAFPFATFHFFREQLRVDSMGATLVECMFQRRRGRDVDRANYIAVRCDTARASSSMQCDNPMTSLLGVNRRTYNEAVKHLYRWNAFHFDDVLAFYRFACGRPSFQRHLIARLEPRVTPCPAVPIEVIEHPCACFHVSLADMVGERADGARYWYAPSRRMDICVGDRLVSLDLSRCLCLPAICKKHAVGGVLDLAWIGAGPFLWLTDKADVTSVNEMSESQDDSQTDSGITVLDHDAAGIQLQEGKRKSAVDLILTVDKVVRKIDG